jgi:hypothetical protein
MSRMDLSKYPIERLFQFAAGIIPGFVMLAIFRLAHPQAFDSLMRLGFLGYKTMLAVALVTSFIAGYTLTTFINGMLGAIGAISGHALAQQPFRPAHSFGVAPWRDHLWRTALKRALGPDAPEDTLLITDEAFQERKQILDNWVALMGSAAQQQELSKLQQEKLASEINDGKWRQWYEHYHRVVIEKYGQDFTFYIRTGLNFNLEAAGVYVLLSAIFVPSVRQWWALVSASIWVFMGIAEVFHTLQRYPNRWSTLFQQIDYLSNAAGPEHSKQAGA